MTGFLVVNSSLKSEKFNMLHNHLVKTAKEMEINLVVKTNFELCNYSGKLPDFILFWDKDVSLAKYLEKMGAKVFNSSDSIEKCDNKAKTYLELLNVVDMPKTIIPPLSFFDVSYDSFVDMAVDDLGLPLVFKECFGSFGEQVFLCSSKAEILFHISKKPFILQQFIKESAGADMRLQVVGNEVVCAMKRTNNLDFRSNLTNGGSAKAYLPTSEQKEIAVKACNALGLSFGGVDILNNNMVCEVNSNAHIINILECTKIDTAKYIFAFIKEQIK